MQEEIIGSTDDVLKSNFLPWSDNEINDRTREGITSGSEGSDIDSNIERLAAGDRSCRDATASINLEPLRLASNELS